MEIVELRLRKGAKFHFGEGKLHETANFAHSDTLASAIINNHIRANGTEGLDAFLENFPTISSVFPYIKHGGETTYFLPMPIQDKVAILSKTAKRAKFITQDALDQLEDIASKNDVSEHGGHGGYLLSDREANTLGKIMQPGLFRSYLVERVPVARNGEQGTPYYVRVIQPREGKDYEIGLYFMVSHITDTFWEAVCLMEIFGLGGRMSSLGSQIRETSRAGQSSLTGIVGLSLGLMLPTAEQLANSTYRLIRRGGYIGGRSGTEKRKKEIYMLYEGSIVPTSTKRDDLEFGKFLNVSPDETPVYKYANPIVCGGAPS